MKKLILILFAVLSVETYAQNIVIESEKDLEKITANKINKGYGIIVDGPEDPLEFEKFLLEIDPKIEEKIAEVLAKKKPKNEKPRND